MSSRSYTWSVAAVLALGAGCAMEAEDEVLAEAGAEARGKVIRAERPIAGRYIVVLEKAELSLRGEKPLASAQGLARAAGAKVTHEYEHALAGFAGEMSEASALALAADPRVAYVAEDGIVELAATQSGAAWGLDRIDQRDLGLNGNYTYHSTGAGVHAYVIDTGMRLTHGEYAGRVGNGYDAVTAGGNASDCNGHGTHVAGTIGGSTYGVAKSATLHPVRVLDCSGSGSYAGVIAGINWVTANHVKPAVANMSLGGGAYQPVDDAVTASVNAGVTYAIAAGNSNANACNYSPARTPAAITVGSTDSNDARSSFSNYGSCVDLFAPGGSITSAWYSSDTATAVLSGTSMAAPHAAGVAALYLQLAPTATPAQVAARLTSAAVAGAVGNPGTGSPNLLLHNGLRNISLRAGTGHYLVAEGGGGSFVAADRGAIGNWERFDVADLNGGTFASGDTINLRVNNGSYMVAEGGGGGVVNADRTVASTWESFRIWNLDGGTGFGTGTRVALQAVNNQYVVAEGGGGGSGSGSVNANRGAIGPWEIFTIAVH